MSSVAPAPTKFRMRSEETFRGGKVIGAPVWGINSDSVYHLMGRSSNDVGVGHFEDWRRFDLEFALELVRRSCRYQSDLESVQVRGVIIKPQLALSLWMRGEITNRDIRTSVFTPYVGNPWLVMADYFGDELDLVVARSQFNVFDVMIADPRERFTAARVGNHDLPRPSLKPLAGGR